MVWSTSELINTTVKQCRGDKYFLIKLCLNFKNTYISNFPFDFLVNMKVLLDGGIKSPDIYKPSNGNQT